MLQILLSVLCIIAACGKFHTVVVTEEGTSYSFGSNKYVRPQVLRCTLACTAARVVFLAVFLFVSCATFTLGADPCLGLPPGQPRWLTSAKSCQRTEATMVPGTPTYPFELHLSQLLADNAKLH